MLITASLRAGAAYFAIVFAIGFLLGALRVLVLEPAIGTLAAALAELPIILTASWMICRWLVRINRVPETIEHRALMGIVAFGLLMIAELGLGTGLFDQSIAEHFEKYRTLSGGLGLLGQIVFAGMPLFVRSGVFPDP